MGTKYIVVMNKIGNVSINKLCDEKGCNMYHHFTTVDDKRAADIILNSLNASIDE